MIESNPISISMNIKFNHQIFENKTNSDDIAWYQSVIKSLFYAVIVTWPDIAFAVSTLKRYIHNSNNEYINAIKKIFRYLKKTINYNIKYYKNSYIIGYINSDYTGDKIKYKSISGYIFYLANESISYQSKL